MSTKSSVALPQALAYSAAGLAVIPVHADGSKAPDLMAGHPVLNRSRPPTDDEIRHWWKQGHRGVAVLCGKISGNAECLDFDRKDVFAEWYQLAAGQLVGLSDCLCVIETPRGYHVWYRSAEAVDGNTKLAGEPVIQDGTVKVKTLIETRGEGGYAIVPGGPPEVHETRKPYKHAEGRPLTQLHVFSPGERAVLLSAARSFNRHAEEPRVPPAYRANAEALRPGDDFNRGGPDWPEILEPGGWRATAKRGDVCLWKRPDKKEKGHSATTGACKAADGSDLFYVFSSNAHPFQERMGYSKFRAYALLHHQGDLSAAAAQLRADGYGGTSPGREPALAKPAPSRTPAGEPPKVIGLPGPDESFTAAELLKMKLPPARWAVPELIPEGLSILGGRPKTGKSWLALHMAIMVAIGGAVLGTTPVEPGPVLYLALEDTKRRLQNRLKKILTGEAPDNLHLRTRWPRLQEGGDTLLRGFVAQHKPRLVIVDTLAKVRGARRRSEDCYAEDYAFIERLKDIADKECCPVVALHHTSKTTRLDPVDEISGTLGLSGAADAILVLKRQRGEHECSLFVTGRDIEEEREIAITADVANKIWLNHGSADQRRASRERVDILTLLSKHPAGLRPRELADLLGKHPGAIRGLLFKMTDDDQVNTDNGKYILTDGGRRVLHGTDERQPAMAE